MPSLDREPATEPPAHADRSADFEELVDLAAERFGGVVLWANDEFFAGRENLLKAAAPIFVEERFTERGKWMDGWETRRRREPGFDSCIIRLGIPGIVHGVIVDTAFFRGNFPEACSLAGLEVAGTPTLEELRARNDWVELLPRTTLQGDSRNRFPSRPHGRLTHVRFNIFPDGGVARLRLHGEPRPDWRRLLARGGAVDLAALEHGGKAVSCSDMFFSDRRHLLLPGDSTHMADGWETRRRRGPGHDWVIIALGCRGAIERVVIDTTHFKGNAPDHCYVDVCDAPHATRRDLESADHRWLPLVTQAHLLPHSRHELEHELSPQGPVTHARLRIIPDGGIARLRLYGRPEPETDDAALRVLNSLREDATAAMLRDACGASAWVKKMLRARPFAARRAIHRTAEDAFAALGEDDWLEAFGAHPEIGGQRAAAAPSAPAAAWSAGEQAGVAQATDDVALRLAALNVQYREKFGFIFIVCASGKSAEEMLAILAARLAQDRDAELRNAAAEQRKITALRLDKWLAQHS